MGNPFQSIASESKKIAGLTEFRASQGLGASRAAQAHLISIKGWLRFLSILGFVVGSIMFVVMIIYLYSISVWASMMGGGLELLWFLLLLVMTVLIFNLSLRLLNYASAISRMSVNRGARDLEKAMIQQMKLWRVSGILVCFLLILVLVGLVS